MTQRRFDKGFFSPERFAVADRYLEVTSRGRLFAIGAFAAVAVGALFLGDAFLGRAASIARGPLSDSHALFGQQCSTCHVPMGGVPNEKCTACHQQSGGALGPYTFARHYLYQSGDHDRSAPGTSEVSCASCHREHQGRQEPLREVADASCTGCHEVSSFRRGHPEFEFAAQNLLDPANLHFPHVLHVREVMEEYDLIEAEASCLKCHTPQPDGRSFQPISFARHCDACHLSPSTATAFLPIQPRGSAKPGVITLGEIRRAGGPSGRWADYWNPGEFREQDGRIQKRPVFHEDPWILYNLQQLRRQLYPGAELADLLRTSAEVPARDVRMLYGEAIATLRGQIEALRGDPSQEIQRELATLKDMLVQLEGRLDRPFASIDETRFDVRFADRAAGLASGAIDEAAFNTVVDSLAAPCLQCHVIERATLRRVQTDQRTMWRAEFSHRAHVIHARCLDCHSAIPVRNSLLADTDLPAELDHAGIQNLPAIATCRDCHAPRGPADRCTSCHLFHPDKAHWSNLSR
jgi:predicted CXXCH cytochrome family protein